MKVKKGAAITFIIAIVILITSSYEIVDAKERGVLFVLGKASKGIVNPGFHFKLPFANKIRKYSIVPKKLSINIPITENGAISKDNQIIGIRMVSYWQYDPKRIYEAATNFTQEAIENQVASQTNASVKVVIGKRTIYELAETQDTLTTEIEKYLKNHTKNLPIIITQMNLSNITWSRDFDRQIQETMNRTQQVKQAEQEANIATQQQKKLTIEAQAKASASIAQAEGEKKAAKLKAEARLIEAESIAKANKIKAQPSALEYQKAKWDYEIKIERAKRFNGAEIQQYVPLTPTGGIVSIPIK